MKNWFKIKKCNDTTKWVIYSDEFYKKLLESHPMTPSVFLQFHLRCLNKNSNKIHKHYYEQSDELFNIINPKINKLNKEKTIHQLYAQRMVSRDGLFDVEISTTVEETIDFLNWYFNLIIPYHE